MKDSSVLQPLLRPIYEFILVLIAVILIVVFITSYSLLLLTFESAIILSGYLFAIATLRFIGGYKIYRYQKGMLKLPFYELLSKEIPISSTHLFLGKGFLWEQKHTQRLEDTKLSINQKYLTNGRLFTLVRDLEPTSPTIYNIFHTYKPDRYDKNYWPKYVHHIFNPFKPLPPVGGNPAIHAVGMYEGEKNIYQPLDERGGHTLIVGTTGVGKTRLAELLITQDVARGDTVVVFDPKGDAELMLTTYVEAKRAGRPVYIFHLGFPEISCKYNAIGSFSKVSEVAGRVSDQLPSDGNSAVFRDFAWGFVNIVARALVKIGKTPNFVDINKYINNIDPLIKLYKEIHLDTNYPNIDNQLKKIKDKYLKDKDGNYKNPPGGKDIDEECFLISKWQRDYNINDDEEFIGILTVFRYDNAYYSKLVASLRPLLDKLTTGEIKEILSPTIEDNRPEIKWEQIIRQKAVVYVGLDALTDSPVAHAVGAAMFADLTSVAGKIYKFDTASGLPKQTKAPKNILSIHADEFNELIGDQFIPLLNKSRGSGYRVTAYTQSIFDVESGIGSKPKANVAFDNFNTIGMMRVRSEETAKLVVSKLPEYETNKLEKQSLSTDSSDPHSDIDFISRGGDTIKANKILALTTNDFINLPKGQAFFMISGGKLYKTRVPLKKSEKYTPTLHAPTQLAEMFNTMKNKYSSDTNYDETTPVFDSPMINPDK